MKRRPDLITRSGKSIVLKNLLTNLRENDLHYENSKITQCVFLGVLKLKPVPSVFSSSNLSSSNSSAVSDNSTKVKKHPIKASSKAFSTNLDKVLSGKVRKKNPEKIKALVKKVPSKKSNIIKVKFNMNKKSTVEENNLNVPESKTNLADTQNQSKIITTSTKIQYNPAQTFFNKLKREKDNTFNEQSFRNEEVTFLQNCNDMSNKLLSIDYKRSKSPKNKSTVFETNYSSSGTTSITNIQSKISHFTNESPDRIKQLFAENNPTDDIVMIGRELSPIKQKERTSPRFRRVSIMEGNKSRKLKEKASSSKNLYLKQNLVTEHKTTKDLSSDRNDIIMIDDDTDSSQKNTSDDVILLRDVGKIEQTLLPDDIDVIEHSKLKKNPANNKSKSNMTSDKSEQSLNIDSPSSHPNEKDDEVIIISTMIAEPVQEKRSPTNSQLSASTNQVQEYTSHIPSIDTKSTQKNKPRRSRLAPAPIPSIFLQSPRLLRSELSQKNVRKDNMNQTRSRDTLKLQKLNVPLPNSEKQSEITNHNKSIKSPLHLSKHASSPKKHKNRGITTKNSDTIFVSEEIKSSNQEGKPSLKLIIRQKKKIDTINTEKPVDVDRHISQDSRHTFEESKKSNTKSYNKLNPTLEKNIETERIKNVKKHLQDDVIVIPADDTIPIINSEISELPRPGKDKTHVPVIDLDSDLHFEEDTSTSNDIIHIDKEDDQNLLKTPRLLRSSNSKKSPEANKVGDEIVCSLEENINENNLLTKDVTNTVECHQRKNEKTGISEKIKADNNPDIIIISDDKIDIQSDNTMAVKSKSSNEVSKALHDTNITANDNLFNDKVVIVINDEEIIQFSTEIEMKKNEIITIEDNSVTKPQIPSSRTLRSNNKSLSNVSDGNSVNSIDKKLALVNNAAVSENYVKNKVTQDNVEEKLFDEVYSADLCTLVSNSSDKLNKNSPGSKDGKNSPKFLSSSENIENDQEKSPRLLRSSKGKAPVEDTLTNDTIEISEIGKATVSKNNHTEDKSNKSPEEKSFKNEKEIISVSKENSINSLSCSEEQDQKNKLKLEGSTKNETTENKEKPDMDMIHSEGDHLKITTGIIKEVHLESTTESVKNKPSRLLRSQKIEQLTANEQIAKILDPPENLPTSEVNFTQLKLDTPVNDLASIKIKNNRNSKHKDNQSTFRSNKNNVADTENESSDIKLSVIPSKNFYGSENNQIIINSDIHTITPATQTFLSSKNKGPKKNYKTNKVPVVIRTIKKVGKTRLKGADKQVAHINLKEKSLARRSVKLPQNETDQGILSKKTRVISTKVKRMFVKKCNTDKISKITKYFRKNEKIIKNVDLLKNLVNEEDKIATNTLENDILLTVENNSMKDVQEKSNENHKGKTNIAKPLLKKVTFHEKVMTKSKCKRMSKADKNTQNQEEYLPNSVTTEEKNDALKLLDKDKNIKKAHRRVTKIQKLDSQVGEVTTPEKGQETIQNTLHGEEDKNEKQDLSNVAFTQNKRRKKKIVEKSTSNTASNKSNISHKIHTQNKNAKSLNNCETKRKILLDLKKSVTKGCKRNRKTQNIVENSISENEVSSKKNSEESLNQNLIISENYDIQEEFVADESIVKTSKKGKKKDISLESQKSYHDMQNKDAHIGHIVRTDIKEKTSKHLVKVKLSKQKKKEKSKKNKQKKKITNPLDSLQIAEIVNSIQAIEISEQKTDENIPDKTPESIIQPADSQCNDTNLICLDPQKKKRGRPKKLDIVTLNKAESESFKQKHNKVSITHMKTPSKKKLEEIPNKIKKRKATTSTSKSDSEPVNSEKDFESGIKEHNTSKNDVKILNTTETTVHEGKNNVAEPKTSKQINHDRANIEEKINDESCTVLQSPIQNSVDKSTIQSTDSKINSQQNETSWIYLGPQKKKRGRPKKLDSVKLDKAQLKSFKQKHNKVSITQLKTPTKNKLSGDIPNKNRKLKASISTSKSDSEPVNSEKDNESSIKEKNINKRDARIPNTADAIDGHQRKNTSTQPKTSNQINHNNDNTSEKNNDKSCVVLNSPDKQINVNKTPESITLSPDTETNSQQNETSWIYFGPQRKKRGRPKILDRVNKAESKTFKQKHYKVSITQLKTPSKNKLYEDIPNKIRKLKATASTSKNDSEPVNSEKDDGSTIKEQNANKNDVVKIPNSLEAIDMPQVNNNDAETSNQLEHTTASISGKNIDSPVKKQRGRPRSLGLKTPEKNSDISLKRRHSQMSVAQLKSSVTNKLDEEIPKKIKKLTSTPPSNTVSNSTVMDSIEHVITKKCYHKKDTTVFDFDEEDSEAPVQLQLKRKQNKDDMKKESKQSGPINHSKSLTQNETPQKTSPLKSPMKQATIMEMFEKISKEQKQNLAKPLLKTLEKTEAESVIKSKTTEVFEEVVKSTSTRKPSKMPPPPPKTSIQARNEDDDDDEDFSDDDSRAEWIPEEYAEYKFKYSARKLKPHIFRCKICLMTFPSYPKLVKHKDNHAKAANPYECKQCKETFKDVDDLVAHLKIHKGKHPYQCTKCNEGFWTKDEYNKHKPIHILRKVKEPPKKYQCDLCGKAFVKLCDMDRHTRVHTGEKPSICNICGKGFQQSHNLSKHLITHLHIKPYSCEICSKQFNRPDVLARHVLTHAVEKPFKCASCPKSFIRQSQLNIHIQHEHTNKQNDKQSTETNKKPTTPIKTNQTSKRRKKIKIEKGEEKQASDSPSVA